MAASSFSKTTSALLLPDVDTNHDKISVMKFEDQKTRSEDDESPLRVIQSATHPKEIDNSLNSVSLQIIDCTNNNNCGGGGPRLFSNGETTVSNSLLAKSTNNV